MEKDTKFSKFQSKDFSEVIDGLLSIIADELPSSSTWEKVARLIGYDRLIIYKLEHPELDVEFTDMERARLKDAMYSTPFAA